MSAVKVISIQEETANKLKLLAMELKRKMIMENPKAKVPKADYEFVIGLLLEKYLSDYVSEDEKRDLN